MSKTLFECKQLSHRYGKTLALDTVELSLQSGQVTALLGPNGAGKTTLIHLMLGLFPIQQGELSLFGTRPGQLTRQRIGAMLQISGVQDNLTVIELIDLFGSFYPQRADTDQLIDEAGLDGLEQRQFQRLSGGQQQRLLYALAVVGQPDLLILDEPTTGLDPSARRKLWRAIEQRRQHGGSVLLCTHYMDEAEQLADQIVVLDQGRVRIQGTADDVRAQVPNQQIRCRSSQSIDPIESMETVLQVQQHDGMIEILATRAEPVVRHLFAQDPDLTALEVQRTTLESAFLALTEADSNRSNPLDQEAA